MRYGVMYSQREPGTPAGGGAEQRWEPAPRIAKAVEPAIHGHHLLMGAVAVTAKAAAIGQTSEPDAEGRT